MSKLTINYANAWLMGFDPIATGQQLRRLRREHHLTQEQLSELFEQAGDSASRNTISCWESGRKYITLSHVVLLAELYGCSLDELVLSYRRSREADERDQPVPFFTDGYFRDVCIHAYILFCFSSIANRWVGDICAQSFILEAQTLKGASAMKKINARHSHKDRIIIANRWVDDICAQSFILETQTLKEASAMKKINARHSDKDRIICKANSSKHEFFYQPVGSGESYWLFDMDFSGSVFTYFRNKGIHAGEDGFSLTLKELHQFKDYHNFKVTHLIDRLPRQVEYVIKEICQERRTIIDVSRPVYANRYECSGYDDERAA